jgi:hypothetical protein
VGLLVSRIRLSVWVCRYLVSRSQPSQIPGLLKRLSAMDSGIARLTLDFDDFVNVHTVLKDHADDFRDALRFVMMAGPCGKSTLWRCARTALLLCNTLTLRCVCVCACV